MTNANLDAGKFENVFCRLKFVLKLINHSCAKTCSTHTPASLTKGLKIRFLSSNKEKKRKEKGFPFAVLRGNYKRERWEANTISGNAQWNHLRTNKGL